MAQGDQVKNGKAFEFAIAKEYALFVRQQSRLVNLVNDEALAQAKNYYDSFSANDQQKFDVAARQTIDTMVKLEPGILSQKNTNDVLQIMLMPDSQGQIGDVRDVVFHRKNHVWEIGFSAKNNNDAVKHSRLSGVLDFGLSWVGVKCSKHYWQEINPIFSFLQQAKRQNLTWEDLGNKKITDVYIPLLKAFRDELLRIYNANSNIPAKLVQYLIGTYPFYKIIKDDQHNLVVVKAFNIKGMLNQTVNSIKARYTTPTVNLPTRIVEFEMKPASDNTLIMILDEGWEISFRIHNASTKVEPSLKFDIKLLGNPPILFTQHLFR